MYCDWVQVLKTIKFYNVIYKILVNVLITIGIRERTFNNYIGMWRHVFVLFFLSPNSKEKNVHK